MDEQSNFREVAKVLTIVADEEFSELENRRPFNDTMRQAEVAALIAIADELDKIYRLLADGKLELLAHTDAY
jgi:hypothetical protein